MPFEISLEGRTYSTDYLSVAEAVELEEMLGRSWRELHPAGSAAEFQAFATMFLRRDHPGEQAAKIAAEMPLGTALAAVAWKESDLPDVYEDGLPKAVGGSSTTTSSSSPGRPGRGRRT